AAISSPAAASAATLPGFGTITGHTEGAAAVATTSTPEPAKTSLVDEEILRAAEAEFVPEPEEVKASAAAATTTAAATSTSNDDEGLDDLLAELESL
ncbi:TPA: regulator, partial [Klebsiella pneumoniae]|nr:regulator [Klebsiella pneumoniae]